MEAANANLEAATANMEAANANLKALQLSTRCFSVILTLHRMFQSLSWLDCERSISCNK
jgi:hypothetical protein